MSEYLSPYRFYRSPYINNKYFYKFTRDERAIVTDIKSGAIFKYSF